MWWIYRQLGRLRFCDWWAKHHEASALSEAVFFRTFGKSGLTLLRAVAGPRTGATSGGLRGQLPFQNAAAQERLGPNPKRHQDLPFLPNPRENTTREYDLSCAAPQL